MQLLGALGTFALENRTWCRCCLTPPCPPTGPRPRFAAPSLLQLPAPLGRRSNSAAGSDLSIILYPHAFNFYSPVGAIPRLLITLRPPLLSRTHPSCSHQGGSGGGGWESTGMGMPSWWHLVLCLPQQAGHPLTHPPSVLGLGAPAPCWCCSACPSWRHLMGFLEPGVCLGKGLLRCREAVDVFWGVCECGRARLAVTGAVWHHLLDTACVSVHKCVHWC